MQRRDDAAFLTQDHMTTETPAEEAATGVASLSDLLDNRHQTTPDHETHREVGEPLEPDAAPPSSAQPAPTAETPPATPPAPAAAPAAEPDPASDPRAPKWYREDMQRQRRENARLQAEIERARGQGPQTHPDPAQSEEEMNRPLTRGELMMFQERQRLIDKLERSEEAFVERHGDDTLDEVRAWLTSKGTPQGNPMEQWAMSQRNPWAAAYQQYQREKMAEEIGSDPQAYRTRIEQEIRAKVEAEYAARAAPSPAPSAPTMRAAPPLPASTARSASSDRDDRGRFTGPSPLRTKNNFG